MDTRHFARTPKGQDEIANRGKTLRGKLRTILFLVDPAKPAEAILQQVALMGGPPDALAQLAAEGYIAEVRGQGAAPAAAPATPTATTDDELASFRLAKAFMNDTIVDTLGIRAFGFTLRLERCATRGDLLALLPDFGAALAKKMDKTAAQALVERAREFLSAGRR